MISVETINFQGYQFLPSFYDDLDTTALLQLLFPQSPSANISVLKPHTSGNAKDNTYSKFFGLADFPFHTDYAHWNSPPRYMLLRCKTGYREVPTLLIDSQQLVKRIGLDILTRTLVQSRRPVKGRRPFMSLCRKSDDGNVMVRWDPLFLIPASMTSHDGYALMLNEIEQADRTRIELINAGDTLIVDNWRMLHARSTVPIDAVARCIERVYLEAIK